MKNQQREYSNYNKNRKKKYEDFSNNVEVEAKAPEVIEEDQEIQNDNNQNETEVIIEEKPSNLNVKVHIDNLNIRKGPGLSYSRTGNFTGKGVFEIVEIKDGFGKLKSGEGWICLKFCEVLN